MTKLFKKLTQKALTRLNKIKIYLDGRTISATGGDVFDWKSLYTDIYLDFINKYENNNLKGYTKLIEIKTKIESIFDLLKDWGSEKDYSFLNTFEFDAKVTVKIKGNKITLTDEFFATEIRILYNDFYLRLSRFLESERSNFLTDIPQVKPTFKTILSDEQLRKIYNDIKGKFIAADTDYKLFEAVFSGIPSNMQGKIKWILLNKQGDVHKTALREFLTLLIEGAPKQKIIDAWIIDAKENLIKLPKPKKREYSNYYSELEKIISRP